MLEQLLHKWGRTECRYGPYASLLKVECISDRSQFTRQAYYMQKTGPGSGIACNDCRGVLPVLLMPS
jgi:hypothetical protein